MSPTVDVSMIDMSGLQSQIPMAGMANFKIVRVLGASVVVGLDSMTFGGSTFSGSSLLPCFIVIDKVAFWYIASCSGWSLAFSESDLSPCKLESPSRKGTFGWFNTGYERKWIL